MPVLARTLGNLWGRKRVRLPVRPLGTRLALDEGKEEGSIQLRILPDEAQLVEKDGVWIIRSSYLRPEDRDIDWIVRAREERSASVLGDG